MWGNVSVVKVEKVPDKWMLMTTKEKKNAIKKIVNDSYQIMKESSCSLETAKEMSDISYIDLAEEVIDKVLENTYAVMKLLDDAMGCTATKEGICRIIYNECGNCKFKDGFFKMARKIRTFIRENIELLSIVDPDDKFGKIAALRVLDEYCVEETKNIWDKFSELLSEVCCEVSDRLEFTGTYKEKLFNSVGNYTAFYFEEKGNVLNNIKNVSGKADYAFGRIRMSIVKDDAIKHVYKQFIQNN